MHGQGRRHRRRDRAQPGRELRGHGHHDRASDRRRVLRPVPEPRLLRDHPADRAEQHRRRGRTTPASPSTPLCAAGVQQHAHRHGPGRPGLDLRGLGPRIRDEPRPARHRYLNVWPPGRPLIFVTGCETGTMAHGS